MRLNHWRLSQWLWLGFGAVLLLASGLAAVTAQATDAGRHRMCRFTPELQARAQERMRLATDLRSAMALQQLRVVYQPIVDLETGEVRKAEALLRWQHPDFGAVSPARFIPIAESIGLIGEIGDWVFRTAAVQARDWR